MPYSLTAASAEVAQRIGRLWTSFPRTSEPPGIPDVPILGSLPDLVHESHGFFRRVAREAGPVVRLRLAPGVPLYFINDPHVLEEVLVHKAESFRKDYFTRSFKTFLGDGLLVSEGDVWRAHRRAIQPQFSPKHIHDYAERMGREAGRTVEGWLRQRRINLHEETQHLTLRVLGDYLFGDAGRLDVVGIGRALASVADHYEGILGTGVRFPLWLSTPNNVRFKRARRALDEMTYAMIRSQRSERIDPSSFLSRLLKTATRHGTSFEDEALRDELVTLILAGHETTAIGLTFVIATLCEHPDLADELAAQLRAVAPQESGITPEQLNQVPLLDAVIREVLRLNPPAWALGRDAIEDVEIGGYRIPRGATVMACPLTLHRDPRWFEAPDTFRPERWLAGGNAKAAPRTAYLPFGAGARICMGAAFAKLEMAVVTAHLLRRARLSRRAGDRGVGVQMTITLRPNKPLWVGLEERS